MHAELQTTWTRIQAELRSAVSGSAYDLWLAPLEARGLKDQTLVVTGPEHVRNWIGDRYNRVLDACASAVIGPGTRVEIVPPDQNAPAGRPPKPPGQHPLNPGYRFDEFIIGDGNRFAHAAALAVAELPGQAYNPLFIYGPPGVGKTHLLHSIGHYLQAYGTGLQVRYTTIESFTDEFITAVQARDVDRFKERYRHNDVLLVDDVQFLERRARTEAEFFHTFNALREAGSQLVLTSDRLPRDLQAVEQRLRERFEAGLVTAIEPPDRATRLTVLRKRARAAHIELEDEGWLELIADRVDANIRSLEGALIRVIAFHSLTGRPLTAALTAEVLGDLYAARPRPGRSIHDIQQATCDAFGISFEDLVSSSRVARISWPRQVAMYLSRELTQESLPAIGREFGNRNHTTVLHAHRAATRRLASDPEARRALSDLTARLEARP